MPRRIKTTCEDCHDGERPILGGQIVSKGAMPYKVCSDCGTVVDGSPGLLAHLYQRVTGHWPWQDEN